MPIHEYQCNQCGKSIEIWEGKDFKDVYCTKCKKEMKRIISGSTFILKGGGWYSEGYNKKKESE